MTTQILSAWDALERTKASRREKSVKPALIKIHPMILEAADKELTFLDLTDFMKSYRHEAAEMIRNHLTNIGYNVNHNTTATTIGWSNATAPRTGGGRD